MIKVLVSLKPKRGKNQLSKGPRRVLRSEKIRSKVCF
jgi:hypothetical protein